MRFSGEKMQAEIGGKKHGEQGGCDRELGASIRIDE